jgi:hypothetical protein
VVAQVALAVVLLSAAGLMLNSVVKLSRVRPGFDADHLLTFRVALNGANCRGAFTNLLRLDLLARLQTTPGVQRGGLVDRPVRRAARRNGIEIEGRPATPGQTLIADQRHVSSGYFQTMNVPLLEGAFTAADDARGERSRS